MTIRQNIQDLLNQRPFLPFSIHLSDGKSYTVENPFVVAMMKSTVLVALLQEDRYVVFPYLHVSSIEVLRAA